ncbi:hypothetical protein Tco_1042277 [Tanacetum coccineum]|uniref:Uncharacterized protein n=1 Tax=Tanacetum coccineum TaxID=301880 RepID=A0ABQ5GKS5_9ASTR
MVGFTHNQLKNKIFDEVQKAFDKTMREELESKSLKKQKLDENVEAKVNDDLEEAEMKNHIEIIPDDEVAIDAIPLATKPPIIFDWKIIKEGKIGYFQIIRTDGSSKRLEEAYKRVLWGDLKVMLEPDVESEVWRNLQGHKVDYAKIIWEDLIHKLNKKTREKIVPYPSFLLLPEHMMPEYENEELTINPTQFGQGKEAQQATGGPTSLGATSEKGAHPQLSSDKTKYARDGLKTAHIDSGVNEESRADDISLKVKLEDLSDILKDTRSAFFTPDSPPNELIIVSDESEEEEEVAKDKDTKATSHNSQKEELEQAKAKAEAEVASIKAKSSYPDIHQLTELMVTSLKPELSKLLASHNFASCLLTKLKELPLKITGLSGEIKELKKHVRDMEIVLPGDLKEILTNMEAFTSTISSISS